MKNILNFILILCFSMILGVTLEINPIVAVVASFAVALVMGVVMNLNQFTNHSFVLACGKISADILSNCDTPMIAGLRKRIIVINYDDIDTIDVNATNPLLIEDITLKLTKTAFEIDGRENTITATTTLLQPSELHDHVVTAMGFDISPATKANIQGMISGRFVIIAENVHKGTGSDAFEIYGLDAGLKLMELTRDAVNVETQGAFAFNFRSNDVSKERFIPRTLYDGVSYASTKALVDGLL